MPDIGEGVAEGEIVRWLVEEGASVKEDQPLVEVLTDKADVEIPSPVTGVLREILARPGQVVQVGDPIARIEEVPRTEAPTPTAPKRADVLATPAVRGLAKELGVDLAAVPASGPGGRVTEEDVRRAAGKAGAAAREERIPFAGKRRMAARRMVAAKTTVPHAFLVDEADATEILRLRGAAREAAAREGVKVTALPFVVQAVAAALARHPAMNASLDEARGEIVLKRHYDIGIAVDAEDGLVVPVVRDADRKGILELSREIERLSDSVRTGKVSREDLAGSTFTVTSIGSIGGLFSYPVINVPEAGILGVHRIVKRPVARDGQIVLRDMVYLSLSFDHRIVDGGTATRFLNDVILRVENPRAEGLA